MTPKKLSDLPGGTTHVRLDDLVGKTILVVYGERAESQQFGPGVRLEFYVWNEKTEKAEGTLLDAFSFAPAVRRAFERMQPDPKEMLWQNPDGILCQVVRVGAGIGLV